MNDRSAGKWNVPLWQLPRLGHILRVLVAQGFKHYVDRLKLRSPVAGGSRPVTVSVPQATLLRLALEDLGPTFVTFGLWWAAATLRGGEVLVTSMRGR